MDKSIKFDSDNMFFSKDKYKPEVRLDDDGFYRWMYRLDAYHDKKMYLLLLKIWAVIAIGGLVLGFLLSDLQWPVPVSLIREDYAHYRSLQMTHRVLFALLGYAVFFAVGVLITGLVRLIDRGPAVYWYRLNEDFIQIRPSGKSSGITSLNSVKRVEIYRDVNEIRLFDRWGKTPVLVRREDFELILDHILEHISGSAAAEKHNAQNPEKDHSDGIF